MASDPLTERAEQARADLRRQYEALRAAGEAARAATTTYEVDGGEIRITVTGRFRLAEVYVSDRALRAGGVEQRLVDAVNAAMAAARDDYGRRLRDGLDADTASLVTVAEAFLEPPAGGEVPPAAGPGRSHR